jgi:hypothetical protein
MLAAYFDDSGTHDDTGTQPGSEIVVAAGYVGAASEWETLKADWNALLQRESLTYYPAVDCVSRRRQFKGRTQAECDRIHRAFIEAITARNIVAIGCALGTALHHRRYRAAVPADRSVDKAGYYNCLLNAWKALGIYMNVAAPEDQVVVVVEDSPNTRAPTLVVYRKVLELTDRGNRPIGPRFALEPVFAGKLGYPQLQAADVLAYEMSVNLRRNFANGQQSRPRRSWDALAAHAQQQSKEHRLALVRFIEHSSSPGPDTRGSWSLL